MAEFLACRDEDGFHLVGEGFIHHSHLHFNGVVRFRAQAPDHHGRILGGCKVDS